jgi:hypothetical protein
MMQEAVHFVLFLRTAFVLHIIIGQPNIFYESWQIDIESMNLLYHLITVNV